MPTNDDTNTTFELTDVQVDTLGLVNRGANQEEFFLLKGEADAEEGATKSEAPGEPEVETKVAKTIWQKLIELIKGAAETEDEETTKAVPTTDEEESVDDDEEEDDEDMQDNMQGGGHMKKEETTTETVTTPVDTNSVAKSDVTTPEIIQQETQQETVLKEEHTMADEVITFSKAEYDALVTRLSNTEAELQKANEEKERQVFVAKAQLYGYIPVATTELAEQLHWLNKTDASRAKWWEDVIKAMDNMVHDSAMFSERGTVQMPTSALDAVMKATDPKSAALSLPKHEAETYLRTVRGQ